MDYQALRELLSDGKFFAVEFTKRTTGEVRVMRARVGVTKYLKGSGATRYNPIQHNLLLVYDLEKRGYRSIPLDGITTVRARGLELHFP